MKKFLFLLMATVSLSTFAQKTTPIYGDTVSIIKNLKVGVSVTFKDTSLRRTDSYLYIDSATGKLMSATLNEVVYVNNDSATVHTFDVLNSLNTPPGSPSIGDTYLVGNSPTGLFTGHAKDVAEWDGASWIFTDAVQGNFLYNATNALTYIFRSGNWVQTTGIPILNNGNTIGAGITIGTNNAKSLNFETNNVKAGRFDSLRRFHVYNLPTSSGADTFLIKSDDAGKFTKIGQSSLISNPIPITAGNGLFTRNDSVLLGGSLITENITLDANTNQKNIEMTAKKIVLNGTQTSGTGSNSSIYGEVNNPGGNALEISSTNTNLGSGHSTGTYISGNTTSSGIYSFGIKLDPGAGGIGITTSAGGASDTTLFTKDSSGHIHHLDKTDFKNKFQIASSHSQTIFVPATTDTVMILSTITNIIAPPTTIGTLYLSLPPSPIDGTFITAKFSEQINTANWIVTDGSTVKGLNNGGLILAGIEIKLYYDLATTTWY